MTGPGPPPNPLSDRQRWLVLSLRAAMVLTIACAGAALVVPGRAGDAAAVGMIVVLVATPIARVAWLAIRWFRRGDLRFGFVALALLSVVGAGALLAL